MREKLRQAGIADADLDSAEEFLEVAAIAFGSTPEKVLENMIRVAKECQDD